jgi:hypothetical protein
MRLDYQVGINRVSWLECQPGMPPVRVIQFISPATSRVIRVERLVLDAGFQYPIDAQDTEQAGQEEDG